MILFHIHTHNHSSIAEHEKNAEIQFKIDAIELMRARGCLSPWNYKIAEKKDIFFCLHSETPLNNRVEYSTASYLVFTHTHHHQTLLSCLRRTFDIFSIWLLHRPGIYIKIISPNLSSVVCLRRTISGLLLNFEWISWKKEYISNVCIFWSRNHVHSKKIIGMDKISTCRDMTKRIMNHMRCRWKAHTHVYGAPRNKDREKERAWDSHCKAIIVNTWEWKQLQFTCINR